MRLGKFLRNTHGALAFAILGCFLLATGAQATLVTFDFGPDTGNYTAGNTSAGTTPNATVGLDVTGTISVGPAFTLVSSSGFVYCTQAGNNAAQCAGSTGLSTSNAYGIGVSGGNANARIDDGETLTFLLNSGWSGSLVSFGLAGFNGTEVATYDIGGGMNTVTPNGSVGLDSYIINGLITGPGVVFGIQQGNGGNFSLATVTFDVDYNAVPEPATFLMLGGGLAALGLIRRKRQSI